MSTPSGVDDILPQQAKYYTGIYESLKGVFEAHNFKRIKTPTIEFTSSIEKGLGDHLKSKSVKFFDQNQHLVTLRPDHTPSIARLVATRMNTEKLPLQLWYYDPVFRYPADNSNDDIESIQAGIEFIGRSSEEATGSVLKILVECLQALGISNYKIDIGHIDFAATLNNEKKESLIEGDYIAFGEIPKRGSAKEISNHTQLKELESWLQKNGISDNIAFDTGLVKELNYYSGTIFECYVDGVRQVVASGGEYNNLIGKYGYDCPAVGFAINVTALNALRDAS
jgi:ATP phosphoribosyltransferase regulatory subunit